MSKEIRTVQLTEFRAESINDEMHISGYATVFDQPTVLFKQNDIEYKEVIDREAFKDTDMSKCCLKYNHESSVPVLARVRGGSLKLNVDDYGLHFDATLFDTQTSRDIYAIIKAGGLDECSFAFVLPDDGSGERYDKSTHTRTITRVATLYDCAIVDNPAYGGTSVAARSFLEAEAEKENLERLELEAEQEKRNKQIQRIKLLTEVL